MDYDKDYLEAIEQAKANLADARARGADAIGGSLAELRAELYTQEEIAASNLRVAAIGEHIKARQDKKMPQGKAHYIGDLQNA